VKKGIIPELAISPGIRATGRKGDGYKDSFRTTVAEEMPLASRPAVHLSKIDLTNFRVASSDIARHINSRYLLNLVREHQPISRADLMRCSGLQRSTVSVITEELINNNWLREGDLGESIRGRRPTFLHLNENRLGIFGINLQQFSTHMGLADLNGRFIARETFPTPVDLDQLAHQAGGILRARMVQYPHMQFEEMGLSLPGPINPSTHEFMLGSNLCWNAADLKDKLESATRLSVCIETTANACALSEMWFNTSLKNSRNIVVVVVSDGIGTGIVVNGQLVRGSSALAGGFGHVVIDENGPQCSCGNRGCWETLASNLAALRYYTESGGKNGSNSRGSLTKLSFGDIMRLAERNDIRACEALDQMAHHLGAGIAMLMMGLAPDAVVVVGEITRAWDKIKTTVMKTIQRRSFSHPSTRILAAAPETQPQLRGAMTLIFQKHFCTPLGG
jgi:predicted NBD/HSP70 family sugar kinase